MTVKTLILKMLDLPVSIEDAKVVFEKGRVVVMLISSDENCGCYIIE